jgi:cathepsin L
MSDMSQAERAEKYGGHKGLRRSQLASKSSTSLSQPLDSMFTLQSPLPAEVDWRTKGVVTAVKDQGHCGSCWAFAATATLESHVAINTGILADLSPQQLVSCSTNPQHCGGVGGCQGSVPELAFDYIQANGLASEWTYPYNSYSGASNGQCVYNATGATPPAAHLSGHVKLPANNATAVMQALATMGPLAVNVAASPWHNYESGVYDGCDFNQNIDINHVVVLVGYGTDAASGNDYWFIRNSWSPMWGEKGYIRLLRHSLEKTVCGVDSTPLDGVGCEGGAAQDEVCGQCGVLFDVSYPTGAST